VKPERGKHGVGLAFALEGAAIVLCALVMLDVAWHRRDDPFVINQFGYRGPARASKRPGERRVVIVGGSAAFDGRVVWSATLGPALVRAMNALEGVPDETPFADVQNVSQALDGADSYVTTLREYSYLRPDVVLVYDGYDAVGNQPHGRHASAVFRSTGYLPILFGQRSRRGPAPFETTPALRDDVTPAADPSCTGSFREYCASMTDTVRFARAAGHAVVVVTPPYISKRHRLQQQSIAAELAHRFAGDARFQQVNLGEIVDLGDRRHSFDGVHTTHSANQIIARALARPVVDLLEQR